MRILLINVAHPAIGSRIPDDHLPPLGMLAIGGPLIDDGHTVRLIDADRTQMPTHAIIRDALGFRPDAVLFGHSGSTSGHPIIAAVAQAVVKAMPFVRIIYGGVYPSYHWQDVLKSEPYVSAIVRGKGEETVRRLIQAMEHGTPLFEVNGIAYRDGAKLFVTPAPAPIADLDAYRIGWELIDHSLYSYWGGLRAVVVQFSRGCPHVCNYCGQTGFWKKWRHRDPVRFAQEIARLHREHGVKVFNFADENPTSSRKAWRAFLEALIAEKIDVILVASTRADDIVRDADILPLYKQAGVQRFLLGLENTDAKTLDLIRKGTTTTIDRQAIKLLQQNGIIAMATWVVGFEEETDADYWRGLKQLLSYDPDQIQMLFVTPHRWTPFFELARDRRVIQTDRTKWDYKHQVLETKHMAPWRVLVWFKVIEMVMQLRPKALWRNFLQPDRGLRHAMQWYTAMGRRVWPHEVFGFFFRDKRTKDGPTMADFWNAPREAAQDCKKAA